MSASSPSPPTSQTPSASPPSAYFPSSWMPSGSIWRLHLHVKARALRALSGLAHKRHNSAPPAAAPPDEYFTVDATLGARVKDAIGVSVYLPTSPPSSGSQSGEEGDDSTLGAGRVQPEPFGSRVGVINVHGGGFVIGSSTDDSRWSRFCVDQLGGAVVFSINHRLAPEYPWPIPVEDVADAILAIIPLCPQYGVDPSKLFLSGFSAGGNLILAAWALLTRPSLGPYALTPDQRAAISLIKGFACFYPVVDYTLTREQKAPGGQDPRLPKFLTDLFDQSYIHPPRPHAERTDPRLSPGLMPDEMLALLPPVHLVICEKDMLAAEARRFGERLQKSGKRVQVREVEGAMHGWDKPPGAPAASVMEEYKRATDSLASFLGSA